MVSTEFSDIRKLWRVFVTDSVWMMIELTLKH